ncbi:hypothetical protein B0H13DRAFT_2057374, partial [Mycena leptocephala]
RRVWHCYSQMPTPLITLVNVLALALSTVPFRSCAFFDLIPYRRCFSYPTSCQFLELHIFEYLLFSPSELESLVTAFVWVHSPWM